MLRSSRSLVLALGLALPLAACDAGTGVDDGQTRILLSSGTVESTASFALAAVRDEGVKDRHGRAVTLDLVDSIAVTITRIEALPVDGDDDDDRDWVSLELTAPTRINLLDLPSGGLAVARGELPAGTYAHLRLHFLDPSITFSEEVTVGNRVYPADERLYLEIPGGLIRLPTASFTVAEDAGAELNIVFDPAATVRKVATTGSGRIVLHPVLKVTRAKPERENSDKDSSGKNRED